MISNQLKPLLLQHIRENCSKKGIYLDCLNCVEAHIHLLVSLGTEQTIAKVAMLIKGESSFWINKHELLKSKFEWQDDYFALSVSESAIDKVRQYIAGQEEHHKKRSVQQEYEEFLKLHGFTDHLAKA